MRDLGVRDLRELRECMDYWDDRLIRDLAERFNLVDKVTGWKIENGEPTYDSEREQEIVRRLTEYGKTLGLDSGLVEELYGVIFRYSKRRQEIRRERN